MISYDMPIAASSSGSPRKSAEPESHCRYGPCVPRSSSSTDRFLEFFCGSKCTRSEAEEGLPVPGTVRRRHRPPEGRRQRHLWPGAAWSNGCDA